MKFWDGKTKYKYLHAKRDGMNLDIRNGKAITRIGHAVDIMFLDEHLISGQAELWYPGQPASYIKTAIINKDKNLILDYFSSYDLNWDESLESIRSYFSALGKNFIQFIDFYDDFPGTPLPKNQEGWILKNYNRGDMVKWKPHWDCDLIVTGFQRGTGKYSMTLGALCVSTIDGRVKARISGMTDVMRNDIWSNRDEYLNRVVEVRHNGILSQGGLRHPRFIRFRDDKPKEECTYANINS